MTQEEHMKAGFVYDPINLTIVDDTDIFIGGRDQRLV